MFMLDHAVSSACVNIELISDLSYIEHIHVELPPFSEGVNLLLRVCLLTA